MKFVKSPLNYTGGKYKLLNDILPAFPSNIDTFIDLFAGGFNVGINVNANKIICNDHISYLLELYSYFEKNETHLLLDEIKNRISEFNLSQTNVEGYKLFRERYNSEKKTLDLFILTCFAFNHQIRFNNKHKFNTPFGKERSSYNSKIEQNLIQFTSILKKKNIEFSNKDFLQVDFSNLGANDLVYCDPPYLITTGSYNDGKRGFKDWSETEELQLLNLLDYLNENNIRFALSNVLFHKGLSNDILIEWSKKYNIMYLDKTYANCNYQFKGKNAKTVEVLITNYNPFREGSNICAQLKMY